ncbi:MAG: TIGR02300 family protein [Alphaproteobacteria bacterium]|nr:TIGR02300 family protein [Alphaproteobacteria bacterium]
MAKEEWGTKRKCLGCGAFFYDLKKATFTCPKCGVSFTAENFVEAAKQRAQKSVPEVVDEDVINKKDQFAEDEGLEMLEETDDMNEEEPLSDVMDDVDGDEDM